MKRAPLLVCVVTAIVAQWTAGQALAQANYSALGELTVTIDSAPGIEVTAYGQEFGSDATNTGVASATFTPFYDPNQPSLLAQGESLTVRSAVEGSADNGEASSFLFSEGLIELFNPTASPVSVSLSYSYQVSAQAEVTTPPLEDAFATAQVDVIDDSGVINTLWLAAADGIDGPFSDDDSGDGVWSLTVDPGATNVLTISGLVDSQGGAIGVESTYALISEFDVSLQDGAALVEWETSAEMGTLGFYLERRDRGSRTFKRVTDELLLGLVGAPNGGFYSFLDLAASPGVSYLYRLVEVEANGRERVYGPYPVRVPRERSGRRAGQRMSAGARSRTLGAGQQALGNIGKSAADARPGVPDPGIRGYQRRAKPPTGGPRARLPEADDATESSSPMSLSIEPAAALPQPMAMTQTFAAPNPRTVVKLLVDDSGLYEITAEALAGALEQPLRFVVAELRAQRVRLTRYNLLTAGQPRVEEEVSWQPLRRGQGLRFYAQALGELEQNLYSDVNVYWLELGVAGPTMPSAMGLPPRVAADAGDHYQAAATWEENRSALPFITDDPDDDLWFWKSVYTSPSSGFSASFPDAAVGDQPLLTPDAAATGEAILKVHLKGASEINGTAPDHQLVVTINGTLVGGEDPQSQWQWNGLDRFTAEIPFDQSLLLADASNVVEVAGLSLDGVPYSFFWVDKFELIYWRSYTAVEDVATVLPASDLVSVRGFTCPAAELLVYDISAPQAPRYYRSALLKLDETGVATFKADGGSEHLLLCQSQLKAPDLQAPASSDWLATSNDYDYVLLTPSELALGADHHASYRASPAGGSYQTAVFTLDDLYDNCNGGIVDAQAIKDCIKYAYDNWQGVPEYLVFVGEGTLDPKNYLGVDENRFPVRECATLYGLYTCDNWFADFYDSLGQSLPDGIAEFMQGRVPAATNAEVIAFSDKVADYEGGAFAGSEQLLWTADNPDGGGPFHIDSDNAADYPESMGYALNKIYFSQGDNRNATRADIRDALNAGPEMFHWVGHGGPTGLADEQLFRLTEAQNVENDRTTIFTALTCTVGYGAFPETESIIEALVVRPTEVRPTDTGDLTGGAASAFAPTGESINFYASQMDQVFVDALYGMSDATTLGEAARAAIESAPGDQNFGFMRDIYHIFGDPALVPWRLPPSFQ